jgi:Bucentaur or craniofacial development
MAEPRDIPSTMEDEYDEEADSDFQARSASEGNVSSSSEDEDKQGTAPKPSRGRQKTQTQKKPDPKIEEPELDSGDEATIQEVKKAKEKKKMRKGGDEVADDSDVEDQGWRARTRAMRERDEVEKKKAKLASVKGSTIDVEQLWAAMNKPGGVEEVEKPAAPSDNQMNSFEGQKENVEPASQRSTILGTRPAGEHDTLHEGIEEMVTIDETYEFAGEIHSRKKTVPKSSAEAKLWLSQRPVRNLDSRFPGNQPVRRPLRKVSRFDPNLNNLDSYKKNWEKMSANEKASKAQKINTVEKSKMDWEAHVAQEGLQDELTEHAKAKGGYLGRMDFLGQVEQRREEEARRVRSKG